MSTAKVVIGRSWPPDDNLDDSPLTMAANGPILNIA